MHTFSFLVKGGGTLSIHPLENIRETVTVDEVIISVTVDEVVIS
jgi:hypothetical protein